MRFFEMNCTQILPLLRQNSCGVHLDADRRT